MKEKRLYQMLPVLEGLSEKRRKMFADYFASAPDWLIEACQVVKVEKNDILVRENTLVDTVYFVVDGMFKGVDFRVCGIEYDFMHFDGVYGLGAMELLLEQDYYQTTLEAVVPSTVIKIPRNIFEKWLEIDIRALKQEAKAVGNYLFAEVRNARLNLFLSGSDRLVLIFTKLYDENAVDGLLKITYTRQELSEISGLCVKTVNRSIKKLQEEGLIGREGNKLLVNEKQYERLKEIIKEITG